MTVEFHLNRNLIIRVEYGSDLIRFITKIAEENRIITATFTAVGALKHAKLGFYDQRKHEYYPITIDAPHEIASCIGNISLRDGKSFVHAHAVLSDDAGNVKAGHLLEGVVFAAEVHIHELQGPKLERKHDETTGLYLWDITPSKGTP